MTVGSLFAGIGGFDLGLERAGFKISWQVEIDAYCQRVLAKHWPHVQRYGDIRAIDWSTVPGVDVLCGGFPCQDLSFAGKRAGIDGERSGLWSEYVRAICALRPRFIIVENVPGLLTNEYMGRVLGDLAACGYDAEWHCIPACAVGAPHRRDRVWIIAHSKSDRTQRGIFQQGSTIVEDDGDIQFVADSIGESAERRHNRLEWGQRSASKITQNGRQGDGVANGWWAVEPPVGRVAHGIPHRVDRLRGLGNAVVPQIVQWLGERIVEAERENMHRMQRDEATQ